MTHAIGTGTENVATNMAAAEARIHGQTAFGLAISRGELIREALLLWYEQKKPDAARAIRTIREHRREIGTAIQLGIIIAGTLFGSIDQARALRPVKAARQITRRFEEA